MKKKVEFCIGLALGFSVAILLWKPWASLIIGVICIVLWAVLRRSYNKVLSCFLAACLGVSPNVLADYSAGYNGQSCYCFTPAAEDPNPPAQEAVVLEFIVESGQARFLNMRHPTALVDYDTFNASLAAWGIDLNGGMQYATNGQPATAADVPFTFGDWSSPLTIFPDRVQYPVVLEMTTELGEFTYWQTVAHFSVPEGTRVQVMDSPEGAQTFYRLRVDETQPFQPAGPLLLGCGLGLLAGSAVVAVLVVRACARNKKKFEAMLPPKDTNAPPRID